MSRTLFPASVVGSMPRSAFVLDLINARPPLARAAYEIAIDAAVRYIVALQEHAGLDVVTDGEFIARETPVTVIQTDGMRIVVKSASVV